MHDHDEEETMPLQFGIAMDDYGTPVVVMILPDFVDPDTGGGVSILIGDAEDAEAFAAQVVQAAVVTTQIADELGPAPTEAHTSNVLAKYAALLAAPFN